MAKIVCTKCGLTGDSKNPWTRSIFVERTRRGTLDTAFSWIMGITELDENDDTTITFKLHGMTAPEALARIKSMLDDEAFDPKVHGCTHEWDMAPGCEPEV